MTGGRVSAQSYAQTFTLHFPRHAFPKQS